MDFIPGESRVRSQSWFTQIGGSRILAVPIKGTHTNPFKSHSSLQMTLRALQILSFTDDHSLSNTLKQPVDQLSRPTVISHNKLPRLSVNSRVSQSARILYRLVRCTIEYHTTARISAQKRFTRRRRGRLRSWRWTRESQGLSKVKYPKTSNQRNADARCREWRRAKIRFCKNNLQNVRARLQEEEDLLHGSNARMSPSSLTTLHRIRRKSVLLHFSF